MLISNINETAYQTVNSDAVKYGAPNNNITSRLFALGVGDNFLCSDKAVRSIAHSFAKQHNIKVKTAYVEDLKGFRVWRIK